MSLCVMCVCVCVPTEQHEHLESTCPTHTLKTETDQVSVSAILPFVHPSIVLCFVVFKSSLHLLHLILFKCHAAIISASLQQLITEER